MESNQAKTIKGMRSQTLVTITLGVVEILSFTIMSRLLTPKDFGYYAAISAVMVIFSPLSDAGIGSAIVQRKNLDQQFLNNAFTLSLIFGLATCLALIVSSDFLSATIIDKSMTTPLKLMSLTLITHSLSSSYIGTLHRNRKFLTMGMISLISLVLTTIISVILAYLGYGYYAIIAKTVTSSVLTMLLAAFISKTKFNIEWDKETIKSIWGFSGWLMFSSIFRNFTHQVDRLLMSRLLSVESLGAYNRPKEFITQISTKFNGIFDSSLFPVLSGVQDDLEKVRNAYKKSLSYLNVFSIVMMMAFFFNAELLVHVFFGSEWLNIVPTFQILSCSLVFQIDARLADCFLRSLGWTKQQFLFRIFEVTIQIIGLLCFSKYGIIGVASSVVIVNILCIWIKNFYITFKIGISQVDSLKIILSSWKVMYFLGPIMLSLVLILPHSLLYNILTFIIFCILLIIAFLFVPSIVGTTYKTEMYQKVQQFMHPKNKSL